MKTKRLQHQFVGYIPEILEPGKLYISLEYATAIHKCCCGCGREVVTPFSPRDWKMIFDGESVSLSPSIGNWNFPCRSHYFIREGCVIEAHSWDDELETKQPAKALKNGTRKEPKQKGFSRFWRKLLFKS